MLDAMQSSLLFSDDDKANIEQATSSVLRCEGLIKCVIRKDKVLGTCYTFLQKLRDCQQHNWVYEKLKSKKIQAFT